MPFYSEPPGHPCWGQLWLGSSRGKYLESYHQHPRAGSLRTPRAPVQCKTHHLLENKSEVGVGKDFLGGWISSHRGTRRWRWEGRSREEDKLWWPPVLQPHWWDLVSWEGYCFCLSSVLWAKSHKALKFRRKWHFCYPRRVESFHPCPDSGCLSNFNFTGPEPGWKGRLSFSHSPVCKVETIIIIIRRCNNSVT